MDLSVMNWSTRLLLLDFRMGGLTVWLPQYLPTNLKKYTIKIFYFHKIHIFSEGVYTYGLLLIKKTQKTQDFDNSTRSYILYKFYFVNKVVKVYVKSQIGYL